MIDRYDLEILPVCLALHMAHTGSADPLPAEDKARYVTWLRQRLIEWQPAHAKWERFDEAVKVLILATLDEVDPMPLDVLTPDERDLVIAAIPLQAGLTRDGQRVIAAAEMAVTTGEPWTPKVGDRVVTRPFVDRPAPRGGDGEIVRACGQRDFIVRHDGGDEVHYDADELSPAPEVSLCCVCEGTGVARSPVDVPRRERSYDDCTRCEGSGYRTPTDELRPEKR